MSNIVPQLPQDIINNVAQNTTNIVKSAENVVQNILPANMMNIFGYKLSKTYVYIFIGVAVLILGYFIYKWYVADTEDDEDDGQLGKYYPPPHTDDINYNTDEEIPSYPPAQEQMHAPLDQNIDEFEGELQDLQ